MTRIEFFVEDTPRPGGSKKAFYNPKLNRAMIVDAGKHTKTWRNSVRDAAREAYDGPPVTGGVTMAVTFHMRRPKSHYRTGRNARLLRNAAPRRHVQKPDRTKLLRSTEDALKGICWHDDCQVDSGPVRKEWVHRWEREGATIAIEADAGPDHDTDRDGECDSRHDRRSAGATPAGAPTEESHG